MGNIERGILNGSGYETWMERRHRQFCDEVEPVHVERVDGENVVWARRAGISKDGYFDFHHIGCDHLGKVPAGQSEIQTMLGCSAVQKVLLTAADKVVEDSGIRNLLPYFTYQEGSELLLDEEGEALAEKFIYDALVKTVNQPTICSGNIREGVHAKPIIKHMFGGVADTQIDTIVDVLGYKGRVVHNDPLVSIAV